jgi:PIN domain nuclease of toxin-antitoxin system
VRFLLDTHVLIWALDGSKKLPAKARDLLLDATHEHYVSTASVWELVIKVAQGKLLLGRDLDELESGIEAAGFKLLPVHIRHVIAVASLPNHHRDPFDQLLIAQCRVETLRLLTADTQLSSYEGIFLV